VYHFNTEVPDAYCVYAPLAVSSLSRLLGAYELDLSTQLVLVGDYLKGLSFLHDKGIMHRDINPSNLAVTSFDDPTGLIIDLDSATVHNTSTDHMQGTLAYLAPEIALLKEQIIGSYDKAVDVWALGLSTFACYTGKPIRWTYIDPRGVQVSKVVTLQGYRAYQERIGQSLKVTQDYNAAGLLKLIMQMTEFNASKRISASTALDSATKLREDRKGKIVLRSTQKRRREE